MDTLVDDVGSFPLPRIVDRQSFNESRDMARRAIAEGKGLPRDGSVRDIFCRVVVDSFRMKCGSGLDVASYPQHYDMYRQFTDVIDEAMKEGTYVVDEKQAVIPEVHAISEEAKNISEETGGKVHLRICVTGPMELYLKEVGTTVHRDVLLMLAETVRRFAKKAMLDSKYVKTEVVSLDEPSFGFQEIAADRDTIIEVLEKAFDFECEAKQIHLHSSAKVADLLDVRGLDVLAFEFAASPRNVESVSRNMLERADKQVRVGIARTDVDSIAAELHDRDLRTWNTKRMVESVETMRRRFKVAKEKYGDRLAFSGPDCGLGGWPSQDVARLLLERAVHAVKS
jgi:5-methyltetrahydropteroyltriglutamate--homocysteine methyltransferase